jgi:hypothetical protein
MSSSKARVSSDEGAFQFESLEPGIYTLRVHRYGFVPISYSNLTLQFNQRLRQDVILVADKETGWIAGGGGFEPIEAEPIPDTLLKPLDKPASPIKRRVSGRPKSGRTRR